MPRGRPPVLIVAMTLPLATSIALTVPAASLDTYACSAFTCACAAWAHTTLHNVTQVQTTGERLTSRLHLQRTRRRHHPVHQAAHASCADPPPPRAAPLPARGPGCRSCRAAGAADDSSCGT